MSIKILSPKLTGTYIDYDSEKTLESIPDSVFSLDEFLGSDLFTRQEKSKHLQVLVDRGNYLLKLLDAYLAFHSPLKIAERNTHRFIQETMAIEKIVNDPLGKEFYERQFRRKQRGLWEDQPEQGDLKGKKKLYPFDNIYQKLDRILQYTISQGNKNELTINASQSLTKWFIRFFSNDVEAEIGHYLTGSIFFTNCMKKSTFVVDPLVFRVLNGGFRKSIRDNDILKITDAERIDRVTSFYEELKIFLLKIEKYLVLFSESEIQKNLETKEQILTNENDLEDIQDEDICSTISFLECCYPTFKKHRKVLQRNGIIKVNEGRLQWDLKKANKTCFVFYWEYCKSDKKLKWKDLMSMFNVPGDPNTLSSLKSKRNPENCDDWVKLRKIISIS